MAAFGSLAPDIPPQPQEQPVPANVMAMLAARLLKSQPQRMPTSYGDPEGDAAAMSPETYVNPIARGLVGTAINGALAPGRALNSTEPVTSEQMVAPSANLAGMLTLGAGAAPAGANELRAGMLSVARRNPDGTIKIGKPGNIHADLMTRQELNAAKDSPEVASSMGFATPDGKFLTRDEALRIAMQKEPERAAWSAQQPEFGLDAATYHNEP